MFMSSPFRVSHRRSRSHTSLSSSSSAVTSSDRHCTPSIRSPSFVSKHPCSAAVTPAHSPFSVRPTFAAQPPEKWDVEAWRRGKRARRDPENPSEDADMDSYDEPMPSSRFAEAQPLANSLSISAPSTPHSRFAASSDAFQFFPSKTSSSSAAMQASAPLAPHTSLSDLNGQLPCTEGIAQLHSDAFSDLRKTVSEAGEGFVRRMREFEAHRGARPSRVSTLPSQSDGPDRKLLHHKRGRKRPSPLSARQFTVQLSHMNANHGKETDFEEGETDVEIWSNGASRSDDFRDWTPSKKRAVSLSALSDQDAVPLSHPHSLPFPIPLRSRERSSSPSASAYSNSSSDEDEEITSSSVTGGSLADRVRHQRGLRFRRKVPSAKFSPPPLSFSFSASNNSSRMSLGASVPSPISLFGPSLSLSSSPDRQSTFGGAGSTAVGSSGMAAGPLAPRTSKRAEKAVAALSLALANGAGSVSDYEALREAQGVLAMEDSEAGSLWD